MKDIEMINQMERLHRVIHQINIEKECLKKIDRRIEILENERANIVHEILDMEG